MTSPSQFPPADSTPIRHDEPGTQARPAEVVALLDTAATELAREFDGAVEPDTVRQVVAHAYDELAAEATIAHHLPVLATRNARRRLAALTTGAPAATDSEGTA
ncbi:three-helix bundle dimerization domain-containing protein [Actinokineospora sp. NPDC004072]